MIWSQDLLFAQAKSTHETQVVFAIDKETPSEIKDILLFESEYDRDKLLRSHAQYYLFSGIISGRYKQGSKGISPLTGASLVLFTQRPLSNAYAWDPAEHYQRGDRLKLSESEALITSKNKGEINIKIE